MAINRPLIHEIADRTWLVNELGCNNMYILEGDKSSLVIDAGMGYCDFRKIVENITQKPYEVAITHAHPDHVGMIHQFDRICINKKEMGEMFDFCTRKDFDLEEFHWNNRQHIGFWEAWECTEDMINRGDKKTEIVYIDEGYEFDLGGRKVSSWYLPGHSPGHMYYIDSGSRIAFTGDCVNHNNGTHCHAASTHIRYLQKLMDQHGKLYDRIFTGHSTYCGSLDVFSHDISVVRNLIEAHRSLLRGDAKYDSVRNHIHPEMPPIQVVVYGSEIPDAPGGGGRGRGDPRVTPNVPEKLWEDGEEHIIP
ncbi:hypothetical protein FACS189498_3790 [Spirochaetia bacterium]|nr:hypothetical protein FACS189498_3790 [Spirochaetia bacterium]GHV68717.1 hypothetical protein AGMMS49928_08930 [Spirochaetia bacterium]